MENTDDEEPITPEQKELIIRELKKSTAKAKKVTLENMATPVVTKTLSKRI